LSRSEIVVPVIRKNEVIGVLDVDSKELDRFDETDRVYLEKILELIKF
jgi:GAF domain-containing protein